MLQTTEVITLEPTTGPSGVHDEYFVVQGSGPSETKLDWVEFFGLVGEEEEAVRRAQNRTVAAVFIGIGAAALPAGGLTIALASDEHRLIGLGVIGAGLVSILVGWLGFGDEPPAPGEVLERIERFNRKL